MTARHWDKAPRIRMRQASGVSGELAHRHVQFVPLVFGQKQNNQNLMHVRRRRPCGFSRSLSLVSFPAGSSWSARRRGPALQNLFLKDMAPPLGCLVAVHQYSPWPAHRRADSTWNSLPYGHASSDMPRSTAGYEKISGCVRTVIQLQHWHHGTVLLNRCRQASTGLPWRSVTEAAYLRLIA